MATKKTQTKAVANENIIDVDLSVINRQKFRINGDNNRILELNVSDMLVTTRLEESYDKLSALNEELQQIDAKSETFGAEVKAIDTKMREAIDYIFDANVSEICAPDGSMYDPINGSFRYEHVIDSMLKLYEDNISNEAKLLKNKLKKYTDKYGK